MRRSYQCRSRHPGRASLMKELLWTGHGQPRTSLAVKTGGSGKAKGRMQDTGSWSDIDGESTMRLLIEQSDLVMITSKTPSCVCVGWFTCCTSPKESSRNRSCIAAGRWILQMYFQVSGDQLRVVCSNGFQEVSEIAKKIWVSSSGDTNTSDFEPAPHLQLSRHNIKHDGVATFCPYTATTASIEWLEDIYIFVWHAIYLCYLPERFTMYTVESLFEIDVVD